MGLGEENILLQFLRFSMVFQCFASRFSRVLRSGGFWEPVVWVCGGFHFEECFLEKLKSFFCLFLRF